MKHTGRGGPGPGSGGAARPAGAGTGLLAPGPATTGGRRRPAGPRGPGRGRLLRAPRTLSVAAAPEPAPALLPPRSPQGTLVGTVRWRRPLGPPGLPAYKAESTPRHRVTWRPVARPGDQPDDGPDDRPDDRSDDRPDGSAVQGERGAGRHQRAGCCAGSPRWTTTHLTFGPRRIA